MEAEPYLPFEKFDLGVGVQAELVIWQVPASLRGSRHRFKYRLALVADGVCVMRFDNEAGKGDHKHVGPREFPYEFQDAEQLKVDFWTEVGEWMTKNGR